MIYDVKEFGASVEGSARQNGAAIQSAIDAAFAAGGGVVLIDGGAFLTANIELKSNVTLKIAEGTVLKGSTDFRDYRFSSKEMSWCPKYGQLKSDEPEHYMSGLIFAENAENISIEGPGAIDGQETYPGNFPNPDDPFRRRPMMILPIRCKNIRVSNIQLRNPAMFTFYAVLCRKVWLHGIDLDSWQSDNGDGLDFDGTSEVCISDCMIAAGDDAIGLKTTHSVPCLDYTVTNCRLSSTWAGIRLGPESTGDMKDIVVSNCIFNTCSDGIKIQACSAGNIENVRISNCIMRKVPRPVFMTAGSYRLGRYDSSVRPKVGGVRNIVLSDITAVQGGSTEYQRAAMLLTGTVFAALENITLRNWSIIFEGGVNDSADRVDIPEYLDYSLQYPDINMIKGNFPAAGIFLRHIRGLRMENCELGLAQADDRSMIYAADVQGVLKDIRISDTDKRLTAVESKLTTDMPVNELSGELLAKYRAADAITRKTNALFDAYASKVDLAEKMTLTEAVTDFAWDGQTLTAKLTKPADMLYLTARGNFTLKINGKEAAHCEVPAMYDDRIRWAAEIASYIKEGETILQICYDIPQERPLAEICSRMLTVGKE